MFKCRQAYKQYCFCQQLLAGRLAASQVNSALKVVNKNMLQFGKTQIEIKKLKNLLIALIKIKKINKNILKGIFSLNFVTNNQKMFLSGQD